MQTGLKSIPKIRLIIKSDISNEFDIEISFIRIRVDMKKKYVWIRESHYDLPRARFLKRGSLFRGRFCNSRQKSEEVYSNSTGKHNFILKTNLSKLCLKYLIRNASLRDGSVKCS